MNTKLTAYKLHKSFHFSTAIAGMTERTFLRIHDMFIGMSVLSHAIKNS